MHDLFGDELAEIRAPFAGVVNYVVATPPISEGEPTAMVSRLADAPDAGGSDGGEQDGPRTSIRANSSRRSRTTPEAPTPSACSNCSREITKQPPVMWGDAIVGFGQYHYRYASGREGDFLMCGFSPRAQNLLALRHVRLRRAGGTAREARPAPRRASCLYVKRLDDVHPADPEEADPRGLARDDPPSRQTERPNPSHETRLLLPVLLAALAPGGAAEVFDPQRR